MKKRYRLIVRDKICTGHPNTDTDLECLNCIYRSPVFVWDGTLDAIDAIIDIYREDFGHFIDWSTTVTEVA